MKRANLRGDAELDVVEAALWYESERSGLGTDFASKIDETIARI